MNHRVLTVIGVTCVALLGHAAAVAAPDTYTATLVERPASASAAGSFYGVSIADNGAVVAHSNAPVSTTWYTGANGVGVYFRPPVLVGQDMKVIVGINSLGQVLGTYSPGAHQGVHGFLSSPDGMSLIDLTPPQGGPIRVSAVDDKGRVAGIADNKVGFRTDPAGDMRPLRPLGRGYVSPASIRGGVVVGRLQVTKDAPYMHAFRTGADGQTLVDLGTLVPGGSSVAVAINASGSVVGYASTATAGDTAVMTEPGGTTFTTLDPGAVFFNSFAAGIDRAAHVAGSGSRIGDSNWTPFITGANGVGLHNLNNYVRLPNGSRLGVVIGMNDRGQILANDVLVDDGPWLLTPTRDTWAQEIEAR